MMELVVIGLILILGPPIAIGVFAILLSIADRIEGR